MTPHSWVSGTGDSRSAGAWWRRLVLTPADGKFTCYVSQTNNGKRLDAGSVHPTPEAALAAGLEELRQKLGW